MIGGPLQEPRDKAERSIPLLEEELHIAKTEGVTDALRVRTHVGERHVLVEGVVERGELRVERVAVERAVDQAPDPRQEGDTLIVSVVEERLVVEKRLFVIEELHITQLTTSERVSVPKTIRTMRATIEHPSENITGRENDG